MLRVWGRDAGAGRQLPAPASHRAGVFTLFHLGFLIYTTELMPTSQRRRRVQSEQGVVHRDDKAKVGGYCCYF